MFTYIDKIQLLSSSENVFHLAGQLFGLTVRIPTADKVTEDGVVMSCHVFSDVLLSWKLSSAV